MVRKTKQFYQLNFESLYYNPIELFYLTFVKRILIEESFLNLIKTNTVLSSIYYKTSIETNIYQISLTRSYPKKNRRKFKNRKKNKNKRRTTKNNLWNSKEWFMILNRIFQYLDKKPQLEILLVKSLILEPNLLINWMQFQILRNKTRIFRLIRKIVKTLTWIFKKKLSKLKKKKLSFNLEFKNLLEIILRIIMINRSSRKNKLWSKIHLDYQQMNLNFTRINDKFILFLKRKSKYKIGPPKKWWKSRPLSQKKSRKIKWDSQFFIKKKTKLKLPILDFIKKRNELLRKRKVNSGQLGQLKMWWKERMLKLRIAKNIEQKLKSKKVNFKRKIRRIQRKYQKMASLDKPLWATNESTYWSKMRFLNTLKLFSKKVELTKKTKRQKGRQLFQLSVKKKKKKFSFSQIRIKKRIMKKLLNIITLFKEKQPNQQLVARIYLKENVNYFNYLRVLLKSYNKLQLYSNQNWSLHYFTQTIVRSLIKNYNNLYHQETNYTGFKLVAKGPLSQKKLGRTKTLRFNYLNIKPSSVKGNWREAKSGLISKLGIIGIRIIMM